MSGSGDGGGDRPPVPRLPIVGGDSTQGLSTQASALESPVFSAEFEGRPAPSVPSPGGADADADDDEEDLFGSEAEDAPSAPAASQAGGGLLDERNAAPARAPSPGAALDDETGLFDDDEEVDEKELFGSEEELDENLDEKDLFGDDDEEEEGRREMFLPLQIRGIDVLKRDGTRWRVDNTELKSSAGGIGYRLSKDLENKHGFLIAEFGTVIDGERDGPWLKCKVKAELLEKAPIVEESSMDERDIFGDISEEEEEKAEDVTLRRRPHPDEDRIFKTLRMPNVLAVDLKPFRPEGVTQKLLEGYREYQDTQGRGVVKLLNPENVVRWRFKKDSDGQILKDDDGRPLYEGNTRIVEWEDGSKTLYVGSEAFPISEIEEHAHLFEENSQDVQVCHGVVKTRLVATPSSLNSSTHDRLKQSQFRKFEPNRRSLLVSPEEQRTEQEMQALQAEQAKRQARAAQKRSLEQGQGAPTAAWLEEGAGPSRSPARSSRETGSASDGGVGESVADIKRQSKAARPG